MSEPREELITCILNNMYALKRGMHLQLYGDDKPGSLTPTQQGILLAIRQEQPVNFKILAKHSYLTPGAISQLAEALESAGYIKRVASKQDRRVQCLELTKKGEKHLIQLENRHRAALELVMTGLSTEELRTWVDIQRKLLDAFQKKSEN